MSEAALAEAIAAAAPAKINLALHVTGRRGPGERFEGHHELDTLVSFASHGDVIRVEPNGDDLALAVGGPHAEALKRACPKAGDNLAVRAAAALRTLAERNGIPRPLSGWGAAISIEKNLPVASGMGGGSADAAAAVDALVRMWDLPRSMKGVGDLLAFLGADVPMCLVRHSLRARGIGELIERVALPGCPVVLVNPGRPVATPDVFRRLDGRFSGPLPALPDRPSLDDLVDWLATTSNDLEAPAIALEPAIGKALDALRSMPGCRFARMTGSGATCFGLFPRAQDARAAGDMLQSANAAWWVAPTRLVDFA